MTREEAIKRIQDFTNRFKKDSNTYKALEMAIQALSQEPTVDVLDKIRAEIEKPLRVERYADTESAKAQAIALSWCLEVIDKYTK